jgi:putative membrane protein
MLADTAEQRRGWAPWILGSILMVLLDIVIDPVALLGERWFLGKIYGYKTPGAYFGIPMSNFWGWLLTGLVLVMVFQRTISLCGKRSLEVRWKGMSIIPLWGPLLYISILLFSLAVTAAIGEITLWLVGVFLTGVFLTVSGTLVLYKIRYPHFPRENL